MTTIGRSTISPGRMDSAFESTRPETIAPDDHGDQDAVFEAVKIVNKDAGDVL